MNHRTLHVELFYPIKRNYFFKTLYQVDFLNDAYFALFFYHNGSNIRIYSLLVDDIMIYYVVIAQAAVNFHTKVVCCNLQAMQNISKHQSH